MAIIIPIIKIRRYHDRFIFVTQIPISEHTVLTWWRHQMKTFSALLAICAGNSQWRGALVFSLICTRINGWVNNGESGDLRRHWAHYDVIVMILRLGPFWCRSRLYITGSTPDALIAFQASFKMARTFCQTKGGTRIFTRISHWRDKKNIHPRILPDISANYLGQRMKFTMGCINSMSSGAKKSSTSQLESSRCDYGGLLISSWVPMRFLWLSPESLKFTGKWNFWICPPNSGR